MLLDRRSFGSPLGALLLRLRDDRDAAARARRLPPLPPVNRRRRAASSAPSPACAPIARSGFVVRAEALGDKRLVHNYGHGGAGITLCWGSSKLATELGLPGHQGPVAVIGAGRDGPVHRPAGPGGRLSGHDLRQGAAARHHLEHRRRPVPSRSAITTTTRSRPNGARSSSPRSTIAGAASRSWSATITASAGCRPTSETSGSPEPQLLADLPARSTALLARRTSIRSRSRSVLRYDTHLCRDRPLSCAR